MTAGYGHPVPCGGHIKGPPPMFDPRYTDETETLAFPFPLTVEPVSDGALVAFERNVKVTELALPTWIDLDTDQPRKTVVINLHFDGEEFKVLTAPKDVARRLEDVARRREKREIPSWHELSQPKR